jgi:hypothetical protein
MSQSKSTVTRHEELTAAEVTRHLAWRMIVTRASQDPAFKARLMSSTNDVFKEYGVDVPAGMTIKVVEDSATEKHVVLPAASHEVTELKSGDCCDPGF